MSDQPSPRYRPAVAIGSFALRRIAEAGLLRPGVPPSMNGDGGGLEDVCDVATILMQTDEVAAWVFRAQRLAIEMLVHSDNVGLREHLLPQLLSGERAGSLPLVRHPTPLAGKELGNALRLYGQFAAITNLQREGFSVALPVQGAGAVEWVMLRGEEEGLRTGNDLAEPWPIGSLTAPLTCDGVVFRTDERLGDASLPQRVAPLFDALARIVPFRAA